MDSFSPDPPSSLSLDPVQFEKSKLQRTRELPGDAQSDSFPRQVLHACYTKVFPSAEVENPELVFWSDSVADLLDLDHKEVPYARCYGGHQFSTWAGQLGDGRAITIGEILNSRLEMWELQLKGAGKTPYSRSADGLAVLRSSIREFICSEAMHFLGISTTRALCLVTTGKLVTRDMFYDGNPKEVPGAIVCRVAQSFLHFGSFQIHASRGEEDLGIVRALADYAIIHHFPHIENISKSESLSFSTGDADQLVVDLTSNKYADCIDENSLCEPSQSPFSSCAFCVLLTFITSRFLLYFLSGPENMIGESLTIDYGPFGFLDAFDPSYTPNTTDLPGRRYCFGNQPDIYLWNITQFASSLMAAHLISDKEASYAIERYGTQFMDEYQAIMSRKLDIGKERKDAWASWVQFYIKELVASGISDEDRKTSMDSVNPKYVMRNYLFQSAIDAAELGDFGEVRRLLKVMNMPYDEQPGMEKYARLPPAWAYRPGVCMLSLHEY
ncbi:serine/arginine repetitive matrix protein 2-like [Hibiscus syriacus]|uniref:Selenoprotein O n=1 Tax=Hibiscus syriacus TaxID=106335 RepID=A0A6A2XE09_HIBSY|nr:serine/arginine repetitive matrix protein 2-like [Hibiscus syriacus]